MRTAFSIEHHRALRNNRLLRAHHRLNLASTRKQHGVVVHIAIEVPRVHRQHRRVHHHQQVRVLQRRLLSVARVLERTQLCVAFETRSLGGVLDVDLVDVEQLLRAPDPEVERVFRDRAGAF